MALCMPVPEDKNPHGILPPAKGAKNRTGSVPCKRGQKPHRISPLQKEPKTAPDPEPGKNKVMHAKNCRRTTQ